MTEENKKKPTGEEKAIDLTGIERNKSATFSEVYSNSANIVAGFFDVAIVFGTLEVDLSPSSRKVSIQDRATVRMSWEHAKALVDLIQKKIAEYEADNGSLRKRPDTVTIG